MNEKYVLFFPFHQQLWLTARPGVAHRRNNFFLKQRA